MCICGFVHQYVPFILNTWPTNVIHSQLGQIEEDNLTIETYETTEVTGQEDISICDCPYIIAEMTDHEKLWQELKLFLQV